MVVTAKINAISSRWWPATRTGTRSPGPPAVGVLSGDRRHRARSAPGPTRCGQKRALAVTRRRLHRRTAALYCAGPRSRHRHRGVGDRELLLRHRREPDRRLPARTRPGSALGKVSAWGWSFGYVGGILSLGVSFAYVVFARTGADRRAVRAGDDADHRRDFRACQPADLPDPEGARPPQRQASGA